MINFDAQYLALLKYGVKLSGRFDRNSRNGLVGGRILISGKAHGLEGAISPRLSVDKILNASGCRIKGASSGPRARYDIFAIFVDADTKAGNAAQKICELEVAHPVYLLGRQIMSDAVLGPLVETHVIQRVISLLGSHDHGG